MQPDGKCGEDRKGQLCSLPLPLSLSDSLTAPSQGTFTGYYSSWWSFSPIRVSLDYRFMCIPDFGGPDTGMGPLHTDGLVLSLVDTVLAGVLEASFLVDQGHRSPFLPSV